MAELLFRIGRFAARRHWTVIGAWLALLALTDAADSPPSRPRLPKCASSAMARRRSASAAAMLTPSFRRAMPIWVVPVPASAAGEIGWQNQSSVSTRGKWKPAGDGSRFPARRSCS